MNANALLMTQIAAPSPIGGKTGLTGSPSMTGGNGMAQGLCGVSFIDLIFAQISANSETANSLSSPSSTANSVEIKQQGPETAGSPDEDGQDILASLLAQLDADNNDILNAGAIDIPMPQPITALPDLAFEEAMTEGDVTGKTTIFNGIGSLRSYLDGLLQGLPHEYKPGQQLTQTPEAKTGFKDFMLSFKNNLLGNKTAQADSEAALIATGLSLEELTALMQAAKDAPDKIMESTITLLAPPSAGEQLAVLLPRALIAIQEQAQKSKDPITLEADTLAGDDTASALNALVIGEPAAPGPKKPVVNSLSLLPGGVSADADHAAAKGLDNALAQINENMEKATDSGKKIPAGLQNAAEKIQNKIGAGLSTITQPVSGSIEAAPQWQDVFPEGLDPASPYAAALKPGGLTATTTLTSLIHNAPHATNPHPATQSVAATITKLASNGDDKAFTIKLDPPELGRVEIKMMIDKNNAVKAHLIIEKPETFMMLQRDAQVLERSLQGIGLDTGDGGLSFELAQDNMFQNEGERGGERYQSGGKTAGDIDSADTVMETTMTWHVDPETGMQRYNILA